jgi:hypothetical protein
VTPPCVKNTSGTTHSVVYGMDHLFG